MQLKPNTAVRPIHTSRLAARRELRAGVIRWREESQERRLRTLPLPRRAAKQAPPTPPAPDEDTPEIVPEWLQNFVLGLAAGATIVLAIASSAGAL
ncbi:hypothetical protein [Rhodanobacter lindaniclasticus]